jgi:GNAT superfamily N-acetyltransferase
MEFSIRTYSADDLPQLVSFLNRNQEYDAFTDELLKEKLEGDPFWDAEKALICHDNGAIIGFMHGVVRDIDGQKQGYIKLMAVERSYRRKGVASFLFQRLEAQFQNERVNLIRIYDAPLNYFMPGIDPRYTEAVCFAMHMGFQRFGDSINMTVDLSKSNWDTEAEEKSLQSKGIEITRPSQDDLQEVLDFVNGDWLLWENEVRMSFADNPPSIHVARLDGQIKAFSAHNANNKGTSWFGPMGTHPDVRGKGIGSILLKRCLKDMKAMGHKSAIIPWVGPIAFYAHYVNARIDRVFWRYEKKLKYDN